MTELEKNLNAIQSEKDEKIIPENIKEGVQIFDVVGTLKNTGGSDMPVQDGMLLCIESKSSTSDNYALNFDGTKTEFDTGILQSYFRNGYTIILRLYPTAWNNFRGVFGIHDTGGIVGIQYENGTLVSGNLGTQQPLYIPAEQIPINSWTTVAVVSNSDDNTGVAYINGEIASETDDMGILVPYGNLIIGKTYTANDRYFKGKMSHIIVYNRALSQEEVIEVTDYIENNLA